MRLHRNMAKVSGVGHKLLSKMGWSDGEGLGVRGDGRVDPIRHGRRRSVVAPASRGNRRADAESGGARRNATGVGGGVAGTVDFKDKWWERLMLDAYGAPPPPPKGVADDGDGDGDGDEDAGSGTGAAGGAGKRGGEGWGEVDDARLFAACGGRTCKPHGTAKLERLAAHDRAALSATAAPLPHRKGSNSNSSSSKDDDDNMGVNNVSKTGLLEQNGVDFKSESGAKRAKDEANGDGERGKGERQSSVLNKQTAQSGAGMSLAEDGAEHGNGDDERPPSPQPAKKKRQSKKGKQETKDVVKVEAVIDKTRRKKDKKKSKKSKKRVIKKIKSEV